MGLCLDNAKLVRSHYVDVNVISRLPLYGRGYGAAYSCPPLVLVTPDIIDRSFCRLLNKYGVIHKSINAAKRSRYNKCKEKSRYY